MTGRKARTKEAHRLGPEGVYSYEEPKREAELLAELAWTLEWKRLATPNGREAKIHVVDQRWQYSA
jgi:hypothetical protein